MTIDLILNDLLKLFSDEDLIRFIRRAEKREMLAVGEVLCSEQKTRKEEITNGPEPHPAQGS